jgi:hypothetical protein
MQGHAGGPGLEPESIGFFRAASQHRRQLASRSQAGGEPFDVPKVMELLCGIKRQKGHKD